MIVTACSHNYTETTTATTASSTATTATTTPVHISNIMWENVSHPIKDTEAWSQIEELRAAIEELRTPKYMKIEACPSCGGDFEMEAGNMILRCKWCKRAVFVGTKHINDYGR